MRKIKYSCKNCGWETSIWEEWEDLKPKRCMNKKCNTSFRANPDQLEIIKPEQKQQDKEEKKNGQPKSHKRKESGDIE